MIKRLISWVIPIGIIAACMGVFFMVTPPTIALATDYSVSTETELQNALDEINNSSNDNDIHTITLGDNSHQTVSIPVATQVVLAPTATNVTVTIKSYDPAHPSTIIVDDDAGSMEGLLVVNYCTVILENVIIDVNNNYGGTIGIAVGNGGTVQIGTPTDITPDGTIIKNATAGGVCVDSGTFIMYSGTISDNEASWGGGVYVGEGGTFEMNGGTISDNKAYYYYDDYYYGGYGGGVCVGYYSTFEMNGGTISGNIAYYDDNEEDGGYGGGVYVYSESFFEMNGGTISGNTANAGGGVYVAGTFEMKGGTISGNTANHYYYDNDYYGGYGGGVYVSYSGIITIGQTGSSIPTISGNTSAHGNEYNIYHDGASFTINGDANITDTICLTLDYDNSDILRTITLDTEELTNPVTVYTDNPSEGAVVVEPGGGGAVTNAAIYIDMFALSRDVMGYLLVDGEDNTIIMTGAPAVIVNGSEASTDGTGTYAPNAQVTIDAGTKDGYTFDGWTVNEGGITLASDTSATTTFTMPNNDVTVTANWKQNPLPTTTASTTTSASTTNTTTPPPSNPEDDSWSIINLILCILGGILVILVGFNAVVKNANLLWVGLAVLAGIAGMVVFLLTQDLNLAVGWVNVWSLANATLLALGVIGWIMSFKGKGG